MSSIRIVTDSATDLSEEANQQYGIAVVPLRVRIDDREYIDGVELTNDQFWELSETAKELPQTSAPSVGDFEETYKKLAEEGATSIICVTLSSELSATYQSATIAAKALEGDLRIAVLDSRTASLGEGLIALEIAKRAQANESFDALVGYASTLPNKSRTFGALDTLDNLKRGGRIGPAQAMIGSLLSFKPIIEVADGLVQAESRQRTRSRALTYLVEKVGEFSNISHLGVVHAHAPDTDSFVDALRNKAGITDITVSTIGPVIGTHAGPRTMGVTFWSEES